MAIFGIPDITGHSSFTYATTANTKMVLLDVNSNDVSRTPGSNESLTLLEWYGAGLNTTTRTLDVGVYDITSGRANAPLLHKESISCSDTTPQWRSAVVSGVTLTAGQQYVVTIAPDASLTTSLWRNTSAVTDSGANGTNVSTLPANWTDSGLSTRMFAVRATTAAILGPSVTGPATATSGAAATVITGADLDTVTIMAIQDKVTATAIRSQTITAQPGATLTINPTDTGEHDLRTLGFGSSPVTGTPYSSADVAATGTTAYTLQWSADDGTNPPGLLDVDVSVGSGFTVVQLLTTGIDAADTASGASLASSTLVVIEDNHQIVGPDALNGMNITYFADGTFETDANQTETGLFLYYSPSTEQWSVLQLTINQAGVVSATLNDSSIGIRIAIGI